MRAVFKFDLISRSPFVEAERIILARRREYRVVLSFPSEFLSRTAGKERGASWRNIRQSLIDCFRCLNFYGFGMGSGRRVARLGGFDEKRILSASWSAIRHPAWS